MGYAVLRAIHLLSVVAWMGGMLFAVACLRPAAAVLEPPQRIALMRAALGRFLDLALVAALLVLATGAWMLASATRGPRDFGLAFAMPIDWMVMATLGVAMAGIYVAIRLGPWARLQRAAEQGAWPEAAAALGRIRTLVIVNLVLGTVIIVATRLGAVA